MITIVLFHVITQLIPLILELQTAYNLLQYEVSSTVFPMVLRHALGDSVILHLWRVNPYMALQGFIDSMNSDLDNLTRVLDACQESKVFNFTASLNISYDTLL